MADLDKARTNPAEQFWDELERVQAGLLGLTDMRDHLQPMAPQPDRRTNSIWFFTRTSSDLFKQVGAGAKAMFCLVGRDHDYHACVMGQLRENRMDAKIDEYWSPVVAAWYDGRNDPEMTLLEMQLENGKIWASTGNSLVFGWEIAKANLTDGEPDVGVVKTVVFHRGGR
ncbi:MAG: pyridoxamine 5'-phosphate oxidase family protein [Hyphomicrobiales bacterium]|nr:pyridoxamine 5'-phosphate oxidase family protein [Hyphomicrobiales bacterium]